MRWARIIEVEDQKCAGADAEQGNDRDKRAGERPDEIRPLDPEKEDAHGNDRKSHKRAHIDQLRQR